MKFLILLNRLVHDLSQSTLKHTVLNSCDRHACCHSNVEINSCARAHIICHVLFNQFLYAFEDMVKKIVADLNQIK